MAAKHSSRVRQIWLRGTSAPRAVTISLKRSRSSQASIASMSAPISSTPYFFRAPLACRATAAFRAVWPPSVGSSASGRSFAITFSRMSGVIGST